MVAIAIAVAGGNVRTSALINLTRAVADATGIQLADAVVHVVTNAIHVGVGGTTTVAHTQGIQFAHAVVHVVANAVSVCIFCAIAATDTQGIKLVAIAIAVASGDVRTSTLINLTWTVANAAGIQFAHAVVHVVADAIRVGIF